MRRLVFVALAFAASTASGQTPQSSPVFRSGANLVRLDVGVTDADGRPIGDLQSTDFIVTENGERRAIVFFQHIAQPGPGLIEIAERTAAGEISTNVGSPQGQLYVLVFDQMHIEAGHEQRARRAAQTFLQRHLAAGDRVALFALPGPGPQIAFTPNASRVRTALADVRGMLDRVESGALGTMRIDEAYAITRGDENVLARVANNLSSNSNPTDVMGTGTQRQQLIGAPDPAIFTRLVKEDARRIVAHENARAREFLQRLSDVVRTLREVEGRKTILLFSEGFFLDDVTRELEQVAAAAAESHSMVYALDLNSRSLDPRESDASGAAPVADIQSRLSPLAALALETDGVLVTDATGWMDRALARAASQSRDYYVLGFEPSVLAVRNPHSYRHVDVKVARSGASLNARTGYALGDSPAAAGPRRTIDAALHAPFPQHGLSVEYTTYVLRGDTPSKPRVVLSLEADLPLAGGPNAKPAEVVFAVRSLGDGRVVASGTDTLPLPAAPRPGATTGTAPYRVQFTVPPGEYMMRAIVREPGGLVGSADRRFAVRDFAGPSAAVTDLVLGSAAGALPLRARAFADDGLSGLVEACARTPAQLADLTAVATLTPVDGGRPAISINAQIGATEAWDRAVARRATFDVPLTGVAPGAYVARVRLNAAGEEIADVTRQVEVEAGAAPPPSPAAQADPRAILDTDIGRRARAALRRSATPAAVRAAKGFDLLGAGRFAEAASELRQAFLLDDRNAPLAFALGWAEAGAGQERDAIGAWRAAAAIDPTLIPAYLALADAFLRLAQPALARQALRAGLSAVPHSLELQSKLAAIERR